MLLNSDVFKEDLKKNTEHIFEYTVFLNLKAITILEQSLKEYIFLENKTANQVLNSFYNAKLIYLNKHYLKFLIQTKLKFN